MSKIGANTVLLYRSICFYPLWVQHLNKPQGEHPHQAMSLNVWGVSPLFEVDKIIFGMEMHSPLEQHQLHSWPAEKIRPPLICSLSYHSYLRLRLLSSGKNGAHLFARLYVSLDTWSSPPLPLVSWSVKITL